MNDLKANATLCLVCRNSMRKIGPGAKCTRCNTKVYQREPNSLSRTLSFTIAAAIFYIPANIFPIMTIETMNNGEPSTIIAGINLLIENEMYFIGGVVFFASVVIPLYKMSALLYLVSALKKKNINGVRNTKIYHLLEYIGKWSMLDVFVVGILAGIVNMGFLAKVRPGAGIAFFAIVVVLTMMAAHSFDVRLFWDRMGEDENEK